MSGEEEYKDEQLKRLTHPGEFEYDHGILPIDPANHGPISLDLAKRALERPPEAPKPLAKFLHVTNDYVLVKMHELDKVTAQGIHVVTSAPSRTTGIVLGLGDMVGVDVDIEVGDEVLCAKAGGNMVPPGEPLEGCIFFKPASILAVISRPRLTAEAEESQGAGHEQASSDPGPIPP